MCGQVMVRFYLEVVKNVVVEKNKILNQKKKNAFWFEKKT